MRAAYDRFIEALDAAGCRQGNGWCCPSHDDRNASLSVNQGDDGRVLVTCHAGCETKAILAELGKTTSDLFDGELRSNGRRIVATYDYTDEAGQLLFQAVRYEPKDFRQRRSDGNGGWTWKLGKTRRVLYRLPKVLAAVQSGTTIYVLEGEKDVHAVEKAGGVATCNPMGAGKWQQHYRETLAGADVVVVADRDDAGRKHAATVAKSLDGKAKSVRLVEPAEGKDAADHLAAGHALDDFTDGTEASDQARELLAQGIHPDRINLAQLLDEIRNFITDYIVLPKVNGKDVIADLLALWTIHTWTFEASWATPYLRVTSAAPVSAKTLLLEILAAICRRGWHAVNPSPAVLYRKIDRDQPTLLLDEMDNYPLDEKRDSLAVLNAGYKRGAKVPRCNERGELLEFACFCPKAYAGLDDRHLVPTLLSRSITIRMETKRADQQVEMWIGPDVDPKAALLRARCEAWADRHLDELRDHRPDLVGLINRQAEVWWALLSIGELAGAEWCDRARAAARALGAGGDETDALSPQAQLLTDIRAGFGKETAISTEGLLAHLNGLDESPWGERRKGEGLDARGLARMLRPFKVRPRSVRVGSKTPKGYRAEQFDDVFARYLPTSATSATSATSQSHSQADVADVADVADREGAGDADPDAHNGHHRLTEGEYVEQFRKRQEQAEARKAAS